MEMMCELKSSGMCVPPEQQYKDRVLAYKQAALKCKKNGDLQNAKSYLVQAKTFECVMNKLSEISNGREVIMECTDINPEEEEWLMKELDNCNNVGSGYGDKCELNLDDDDDDPASVCFGNMLSDSNDF